MGEDRGGGRLRRIKLYDRITLSRSGGLRKALTDAESMLWRHLRHKQLDGHKFRRQFFIGRYIADFVCVERKLVIELDGGQHADSLLRDTERDAFMASQGFMVLRFWNHDVLQNSDGILMAVKQALSERLAA